MRFGDRAAPQGADSPSTPIHTGTKCSGVGVAFGTGRVGVTVPLWLLVTGRMCQKAPVWFAKPILGYCVPAQIWGVLG